MSTTTDSRVVELRFDNKEFEANAQQTINTLAQLKQALDSNIDGRAFDDLDRAARNVDLSGIEASIDALTDRFSTLGIVGITVIQDITRAITGTLTGAIRSLSDSIVSGGIRRAQNIENARFQLQGILGDAQKVTEVMKNASDSVDGTAYALDSAANAASQLAASGVEAGEQMTNVLKGIAGVAATTSTDYEGISRIFTQIAGNGRLMGDQLLQLSNRGLNAAATLKDYFNGVKNGTIEATDAVKEQIASLTGATGLIESASGAISKASESAYEAAKKAADKEYNLKKKTYDNEYKALQKSLNEQYNLKKAEYDKQYKALQESLNAELQAVQEANSKRIEELQEKYEADVEAYRAATEQKIALINEEYTESIKLIDEEKYNKLKAVQDQIDAINAQAKAEQKALKDQANAEKKAELESIMNNARNNKTKQQAAQVLADFEAELAREQLAEDRANQIEELQNQKTAINEEAAAKKEEAQQKAQNAREAVQTESNAELKAMQKAHQEELTQLRKQQSEQVEAIREANNAKLTALRESQTEELSIYKEGQNEQLEAFREKQNEELTLFKENQNEMLSAMKSTGSTASKYASKFGGIMDLTEADIRDMVSKGLISFDMFSEAMATTFGEHAYDANKTFSGAMSNIRAALARTGAMFITPLITEGAPLIDLLNEIRKRINEINKVLAPIAETVTGAINNWIPKLTEHLHQLRFAVSYTIENARKGNEEVTKFMPLGNALSNIIKGLGNLLIAIASYIKPVVTAFREVFTLDFGSIEKGSESFESLTKSLKASEGVSNTINKVFKTLFSIIKSGITIVKNVFSWFGSLFSLFKTDGSILGDIADRITEVVTGFTEWIQTSETLKSVMSTVNGYVQSFVNVLKQIKGAVSEAFQSTVDFTKIGEYFTDGFLKGMTSLIPDVLKSIWDFGKSVLKAIMDVFKMHSPSKETFEIGVNFIKGFINGIADMAKKALNFVVKVFQDIWKAVVEFFSDVDVQEIILTSINAATEFIDNFSNTIAQKIPEAIENVKKFFTNIKDGVKNDNTGEETGQTFFNAFVNGIKNAAKSVWNGIKLVFSTFFDNLKEFFRDFSIKDAASTATEFVSQFGSNAIAKIKEIAGPVGDALGSIFANFGSVVATAGGFAMLYGLIKILKLLKGIINPVLSFDGVLKGFTKTLKSFSLDIKANGILKISEAIAILVASIAGLYLALGDMDAASVGKLIGVLVIVGSLIAAIALIYKKIIESEKVVDNGAAVFANITKGIKNQMNAKAIASFVELFVDSFKSVVMSLVAVTLLNELYGDSFRNSIGFFVILTTCILAAVGVFAAISSKIESGSKSFNNTSLAFLELAAALFIIVETVQKILNIDVSSISTDNLALLVIIFGGCLAVLAALVSISNHMEQNEASLKVSPIVALCILLMVSINALKKLIKMGATISNSWENLLTLGIIFAALLGVMYVVSKITKTNSDEKINSMGLTLFGIAALLIVSVAAIGILSLMPFDRYLNGLGKLIGLFAVVLLACNAAKSITNGDGWKSILAVTAAIAIITTALGVLSLMNPEKLITSAASLTVVLLAFAAALAAAGTMDNSSNVWSIIFMIVAIAVISGMMMWLQDIPYDQLLGTAGAISLVLLAFAAAIAIISSSDVVFDWSDAAAYLGGLLAIWVIAAILNHYATEDWDKMLGLGGAISLVLLAMAVCIRIMSGVTVDLTAMAIFAEAILAVVAVGEVISETAKYDWEQLLGAGVAISVVLIAMAVACGIAALLGNVAEPAIAGIGVLDLFIANLTAVLLALGALAQDETIVNIVKDGGEFLALIGEALGAFVGSIVEGALVKVSDAFPKIGENLTKFAENAEPFFDSLKSMDEGTAKAAQALCGVILALGAAELMDAITSIFKIFTGDKDMGSFGEKLASFGESLSSFAKSTSGVDGERLKAVAEGGKALIEMANSVPNEGGWLAKIMGENDLAVFGEKLASFAEHLAITSVFLAGVDVSRFPEIADAMKSMIEMATSIPNSGGWLGSVVGNNDIDDFGQRLAKFASHLVMVGMNFKMTDITKFPLISTAMKSMIEMATSIPNSGGWLGAIVGNNDIDDFGQKLVSFSMSMAAMSAVLQNTNLTKIGQIGPAMQSLIQVAVAVKENGLGKGGWFSKDNSLSAFGEELVQFGDKIKTFAEEKLANTTNIDKLILTLNKFILLVPVLNTFTGDGFTKFLKDLGTYGDKGLTQFLTAFEKPGNKIGTAVSTMMSQLKTTIDGKIPELAKNGQKAIGYLCEGLTDSYNRLDRAAKEITRQLREALQSDSSISNMKMAGRYVVEGFVRGIEDNLDKAERAGRSLGNAAYDAARRALDEHSPSKKMLEVGSYAGEGFVNGFLDWLKASANAGTEIGNSATDSLKEALNSLGKEIQNEDDFNPTITPILDLSEVEKNASAISGLLNLDRPISLASSAGLSFSGGLNNLLSNIQASIPDNNNYDVVTAINSLRSDVNSLGDKVASLQVVMDTGELVGVLTDPIDEQIGFNSTLIERGVR